MVKDKDKYRKEQRYIKDALIQAGGQVKGKLVKCPFHEDRHPSGGIYQAESGIWRFKCHAACCGFIGDYYDVKAKSENKQPQDYFPKKKEKKSIQKNKEYASIEQITHQLSRYFQIESIYKYVEPDNRKVDLAVIRMIDNNGKKTFRQISPGQNGGYILKAPPKPWPLYNRHRIANEPMIVVVEGEKCVHELHKYNLVATTNPAGAGKADYTDWSKLSGKIVYLWPDNDPGGKEHMREVSNILQKLDPIPSIYWIEPDNLDLNKKDDVVDYLKKHSDKETALVEALNSATPQSYARKVHTLLKRTATGEYKPVEFPWKRLSHLSKALLPGTITLLCGDPGSSKSFLLLEALLYWHQKGYKVKVFELEEDRTYHLRRALSQLSYNSNMLDSDWVRHNWKLAEEKYHKNEKLLDSFGKTIEEAPSKPVGLEDLAKWVEQQAQDNNRIIAIDPITAAAVSDKQWIDDFKFIVTVKATVRKYQTSLILVTHPKKGRKKAVGLDELAGGAAYQRLAQSIFWMENYKQLTAEKIDTGIATETLQINRALSIAKSRNGTGHGQKIGFVFSGKSLRFEEKGVLAEC